MLSEAFDSFKENIKQKIANPFLGTLLLVWIVKNWKVVYAFFFFDKEYKLQNRIDYFNAYWKEHNFIWNLVGVVLLTVLILVFTYLFLSVARFISDYYQNVVIPIIQKWSKGKIVTSEVHQTVLDRVMALETKVEFERKAKNDAINERDEFEKRFYSSNIIGKKGSENKEEITNTDFAGNDIDLVNTVSEGVRLYGKEELINKFIQIKRNDWFGNDDRIIEFLLKYSLIRFESNEPGYSFRKHYSIQELGGRFYNKLLETNSLDLLAYDESKKNK